jgi:hypothetical protein
MPGWRVPFAADFRTLKKKEGNIKEPLCPTPLDIGKTITFTVQKMGSLAF